MSIPGPIDIAASQVAQRRFNRIPVEGSVRLFSGSQMWNTRVIDLSLSGVLVERPEDWDGSIGTRYRLDLRLEGGVLIGMGVELARIEEGLGLGVNTPHPSPLITGNCRDCHRRLNASGGR